MPAARFAAGWMVQEVSVAPAAICVLPVALMINRVGSLEETLAMVAAALPVLALPGPAAASGPSPLLDALADPWLARQIDPEDFPAGPLSEADLLRLVRQRLARADSRD